MLRLKEKFPEALMEDSFRLGRRAALLSGLILASAQTLFILYMPQEQLDAYIQEVTSVMPLVIYIVVHSNTLYSVFRDNQ
jgi:hypothetical protein